MKKLSFIIALLFPYIAFGQILIESTDGDEITQKLDGLGNSTILSSINSSDQSLQFKSVIKFPTGTSDKPTRYLSFGLKGKPSDGISTLFSGGNINASTNINLSYTKVNLFSNITTKFTDFFFVRLDYNVNEYTLFKKDSSFNNQIKNGTFQGGSFSFNYNVLLSGKNLLTFIVGYSRKNNYSSLDAVEIRDFKYIIDSASTTTREYGKVKNGRMGDYKEFDRFPLRVAYTFCPSENIADTAKLKLGCAVYYASEFGKNIPVHNIGFVAMLTKANHKTGIRTPIVSIGVQANDISDNQKKGNSIVKRLSLNLATTFNIANL